MQLVWGGPAPPPEVIPGFLRACRAADGTTSNNGNDGNERKATNPAKILGSNP